MRMGCRRRGQKTVNSLATSSWTSPPGSSHQWSLGLHEWKTEKEAARGEGSRASPTLTPPSDPLLPGTGTVGTQRVRTEAGGCTIFTLRVFGRVTSSLRLTARLPGLV